MNESTTTEVVTEVDGVTEGPSWEVYKEIIRSWLEEPGFDEYEGLHSADLKMDQAYVIGDSKIDMGLYRVSDDCFRCPFELVKSLRAEEVTSWVESTARRFTWRLYPSSQQYVSATNTSGMFCQLRPDVGEFGVYRLNVTTHGCQVQTERDPVDIYLHYFACKDETKIKTVSSSYYSKNILFLLTFYLP